MLNYVYICKCIYVYSTALLAQCEPRSDAACCNMAHRTRHKDPDAIAAVIVKHLAQPDDLKYREEFEGPVDPKAIKKLTALAQDLLAVTKGKAMTQGARSAAYLQAANLKEAEWHLGNKAKKWAGKASKRTRAMLHDVNCQPGSHQGPPWRRVQAWLAAAVLEQGRSHGGDNNVYHTYIHK